MIQPLSQVPQAGATYLRTGLGLGCPDLESNTSQKAQIWRQEPEPKRRIASFQQVSFPPLDCILVCLPRGVRTWWLGVFSVTAPYPRGKTVKKQSTWRSLSTGTAAKFPSNVLRQQMCAQATIPGFRLTLVTGEPGVSHPAATPGGGGMGRTLVAEAGTLTAPETWSPEKALKRILRFHNSTNPQFQGPRSQRSRILCLWNSGAP